MCAEVRSEEPRNRRAIGLDDDVMRALLVATALACLSCRGSSVIDFPRRPAPAGYPAARAEDLPGTFPRIPEEDFARALAGRVYRVRYGILPARCFDCPVDARSSSFPQPAEGPFEQEVRIAASDVIVRIAAPGREERAQAHRLIACVDVRLSASLSSADDSTIVLDVQPIDDSPPLPFAVDAVTGERLPIDATTLVDENNGSCDLRLRARMFWDDNLLRLHTRKGRPR